MGTQAKHGRGSVGVNDAGVGFGRSWDSEVDLDRMVDQVPEQDREPCGVASYSDDDHVVAWIIGDVCQWQTLGLILVTEVGVDQFDSCGMAFVVRGQQVEEVGPPVALECRGVRHGHSRR